MLERRRPEPPGAQEGAPRTPETPRQIVDARLTRSVAFSIHVCAVVLGAGALYVAQDLILPLALALVVTLTLSPIVRLLARRGIPAWLTSPLLVAALAGALALIAYTLSYPLSDWVARAPQIGYEIERELRDLRSSFAAVEQASERVDAITGGDAEPGVEEVVVREGGFLATASSGVLRGAAIVAIAALLTAFLLASGDRIYERIVHVMPTFHDKRTAVEIGRAIERSISTYLLTIALINTGLGIVVGLLLWAVGMPTPALFGAMATLLNFLPYIGAILGVAITAVVAVVTFDGLGATLAPPLVYLACTTLEGNVVTPLILGRRLELNAIAILIGVAAMGWLWGAVGVFLAVPLLVAFKTVCDHLPSWHVLGAFLGGSLTRTAEDAQARSDALGGKD
ncbi:AI-2E family transporter [Salinarimonas rosea]|uniref:AI-2E family transporter n=1 Tax=Salinarimonas rosea TaxID=552063 RepID=UPI0006948A1E|nr:AI-2E family transporter [Salinarimonas rosea]